MSASRPTNVERTLGRIEAQIEGLTAALAAHNEATSKTSAEVIALRDDMRELSRDLKALHADMEPVKAQTEWLQTKRSQGVGFIAAITLAIAAISSGAGVIGTKVWASVFGGEA